MYTYETAAQTSPTLFSPDRSIYAHIGDARKSGILPTYTYTDTHLLTPPTVIILQQQAASRGGVGRAPCRCKLIYVYLLFIVTIIIIVLLRIVGN